MSAATTTTKFKGTNPLIRLEKKLMREIGKANGDFDLISAGDRIMVAMSGGKDSYAMLQLLQRIKVKANLDIELIAVNLDQGQPDFPAHLLEGWLKDHGYTYKMLKRDTYSIVLDKIPEGKTYCSLCSRLRRGILYTAAQELGCNKIALGHHRDDLIETVLLNLFYSGQLKSMAPKLFADNGKNVVIRPLAYCAEEDIAAYAKLVDFPILPCNLCGSQDNMQRQQIKAMLTDLSTKNPAVKGNMMSALRNIKGTHLLDPELLALQGGAPTISASEDLI
ncbi:MAG: tRNA 2-thiocytidine(32) synthetase TtcA [Proteobacteria bacterium]|nr:tRNA 2-thiocytidine(32) synthetase TtcA [Pseudomonadota bacterium]MCP4919741.1 tRNA 2-thiocytidine(32) synthetase TtcA [Pseudomonadota bacterium]